MRLLLAARLSQLVKDDEGKSRQTGIDSQDVQTQVWAGQNGHSVIHVAADHKSGIIQPWDRPNLKPWVTDPKKIALYDAVAAHRFDRLSRGDDASTSEIEDWARRHNKLLLTEDGLQYPCEGVEGIRWDVTKRIAHEEWLKTSERYRRMQAYLRSNDYLVGKAPFGFQIVEKGEHKTLAPVPELKPIIIEIVDRVIDGDSLASVCRWLDDEGIGTRHGGKWSAVTLRQILRNESLIGRRTDFRRAGSGRRTQLKFEGIINPQKYNSMIAALDSRPKRGATASDSAMLAGVCYCLKCKGVMHRRKMPRTNKTYEYYRCDGTEYERSTCKNLVPVEGLNSWVGSYFTEHLGDTPRMASIIIQGNGHQDEINDVKRDIADLDMDSDDYLTRVAELHAKLKELKSRPSQPDRVVKRPTGDTYRDYWLRISDEERRKLLLAENIKVYATKTKYEMWIDDTLVAKFGE